MLRDEKELETMPNEEFDKINLPFNKKIKDYVSENIINQFVAYYIATGFKMSALWNGKLKLIVEEATIELAQFTSDDCNIKKIKSILKNEYGLKVIADNPTEIIDIRN